MPRQFGFPATFLPLILAGMVFVLPARACTIFVLTDPQHALFCNNEDWSNAVSRIWFQPAGSGYHGAVYVGFDDGWAQGGFNTAGLAFDWVGGYKEKWEPIPHAQTVRGNPTQRMLESCATVQDAIAFFRTHDELGFARSKILVADRTGASVIIGERDGKLQVYADNQCRGFGYGQTTLKTALAKNSAPTVSNAFQILTECRQSGGFSTKYSNVYDLKNGDVFLHPHPGSDDEVQFSLAAELKKGAHYYDLPRIREELSQPPQPLLLNLERFPLDKFKPIPDPEPQVTEHVRAMTRDAMAGNMREEDLTAEAWQKVRPKLNEIRDNMKLIGDLLSLTLVDRGEAEGKRSYRYRIEFTKATLLVHYLFDGQNKLASGATETYEWKPGANTPRSLDLSEPPVAGIGVALRVEGDRIIIQQIMPDSPAGRQKDLHAGDRIVAVAQDGEPALPVAGGKLAQAVALIHGRAGTTVCLTLVSAGETDSHARVVRFVRSPLNLPPY